MTELKPGYWRTSSGNILELFAERDGHWYGRVRMEPEEFTAQSWTEHNFSKDNEYLGPTMPPEPGEGWRLLRKWPEPEPVEIGDQYLEGEWCDVSREWWDRTSNREQVGDRWYRRRVAPTPPTPPDGWELLPDGTVPQEGMLRFLRRKDGREHTNPDKRDWHAIEPYASIPAGRGPDNQPYIRWYARRIEPEPQLRRLIVTITPAGMFCDPREERLLKCGSETKWVPVEDQP